MAPAFLRLADYTRRLGPLTRYALAAAAIAIPTFVWVWTESFLALQSPFLVFYPAIVVVALYLGPRPALLAIALTILSIGAFILPPRMWLRLEEPTDITDIALFVIIGVGLVFLIDAQRRARGIAETAQRTAQEHAARLDLEVAERRRAEDALRRSNEDLIDFSHIVSHDLKEPLRGISTTAEYLLEDHAQRLPEEGRDRLHTLVELPRRMSALLDALLEYSRVGRAELAMQPADLQSLIAEIQGNLAPWLQEKHAQLEIETPLPTLTCDRARVGQVFSNLISNAVKYNESPEPRVAIGVRQGGPCPVIYIRDNGIGIAPRSAGKLFRMFSRLHPRDRYGGGTGSGLALTKKTVERHGGRIWFDSTPGQGTTFYFTLAPAAEAPPESEHAA
jgi:signal transduction histidine kinase